MNSAQKLAAYRAGTDRRSDCAGVTAPSFICSKCREKKLARGRKTVTPGRPRDGYICAACSSGGAA